MARPRAPRRRLFGSFSSSTPRERARLWRSPDTHTHTRAHTRELLPKQTVQPARAHSRRKDGGKKRRKKEEGASHWRQRRRRRQQQLPERRQHAVRGNPATAAAAPTRTSRSICIPTPGNWGERCGASRRPGKPATWRRAESRSERGRAGTVQPALGGHSRGRSQGRNEPPAGELGERGEPGRGLLPGKGVAIKTRIWSAFGLRRAGST